MALQPDFSGSNVLLGATLYLVGEGEPAYQVLYHAYQLKPEDENVANLLFKVSLMLGDRNFSQKRYAGSIKFFNLAATLRPDEPAVKQGLQEAKRLAGSSKGMKPD